VLNKILIVKVSDEQKDFVDKESKAKGMSQAKFIRKMIDRYMKLKRR